jgi:polyribonucleotide nucleotidyltransferase
VRDGLVHISELAEGRVGQVTDVVKEDDMVKVKVLGVDDRGKIKLSMRVVDQETGEDISGKMAERDAERRAERDARKAEGGDDEDKGGEDRPRRRRPRNDD